MFEFNQLQPLASHKSDRLELTVNQVDREVAWHQAQHHSNPISRYNAYLNGICLKTFLNWLSEWLAEEAFPQPSVWHSQDISSIWELVNGTAIQIGDTRLVLIPSDEGDLEELCVPQEWVDIPNWSADYYIPVQVNLDGDEDECWMEVCGFATHRQLKNEGRYSAGDHTYALPTKELTQSLVVMQITLGLNLQQEVSPLPSLSEVESAELLHKLGNSSVYSPRLIAPFEQWASFLANDQCRQQLYNHRLGIIEEPAVAAAPSVVIQTQASLFQRLNTYVQVGWQIADEMMEQLGMVEPGLIYAITGSEAYRYGGSSTLKGIPTLLDLLHDGNKGNQLRAADLLGRVEPGNAEAISALTNLLKTTKDDDVRCQAAVSLGKLDPKNSAAGVKIGKILELTIRLDTVRVLLEITLLPEGSDQTNVYLRVLPVRTKILPLNLEVIVLDEDGEVLWEEQADSDTNRFQNDFSGTIGDYFQVKVAYQEVSITEDFTI
ncbi:DUF1822 family protein [Microcoleus sp. D3_18_C4]|uniref:DUF1822 family protein n=1 Tax=Microcoleus sp. D3_18_C4 TaxID=3055335 RepID=UPI002FD69309